MLRRQYGANAPSTLSTGGHAEDAQPNETINKRAQKLPPMIRSTTQPDFNQRGLGGYRGRGRGRTNDWNQRGQWNYRGNWNQRGYTFRGESSWRGRGTHDSYPERGGRRYEESSHSSNRGRRSPTELPEELPRKDSVNRSRLPKVTVSTQMAPAPSVEHWMVRTKSPSPKLPFTSMKRRKLEDDSEISNEEEGRTYSPALHLLSPAEVSNFASSSTSLNVSFNSKEETLTTATRVTLSPPREPVVIKTEQSPVKLETNFIVKLEHRSPSPTTTLSSRKLVTESCSFYPYPETCKNSNPQFRENRRAFFREKNKELVILGLNRTNILSRDDGLVIEWKSSVPVWSDTLLPDIPDPNSATLSPSVPLSPPTRKLVTSSECFYPYPESCKGPDPESMGRRKAFHIEKNRELIALGLRRTRAYSKEDGLVMKWTSPVPVWSDTLQPETQDLASMLQIAHSANYELATTSPQGSKKLNERSPSIISISSSRINSPAARPSSQPLQSGSGAYTMKSGTPPLWKQSDGDSNMVVTSSPHQKSALARPHSLPRRRLPPLPGRVHVLRHEQEDEPRTASQLHLTSSPNSPANSANSDSAALIALHSEDGIEHPLAPPQSASEVEAEHSSAESASAPLTAKRMVFKLNRNLSRKNLPSSTPGPVPVPSNVTSSLGSSSSGNILTQGPDTTHKSTTFEGHLDRNSPHPIILDESTVANNSLSSRLEVETISNDPINRNSDEVQSKKIHPVTDETDGSDVEYLASMFLQRYCQLFDTDRSKLQMAYDKNALFSCRVHHLEGTSFSMAGPFAPETKLAFRSSPSSVDQGRTQIANRLLSLGPYLFCPRDVASCIHYDVVESPAGILLTVHGEIVNPNPVGPHMDHILTLDQSFVLRKRADGHDEADTVDRLGDLDGALDWPLIAISHQMTLRAARLLTVAQIEDLLPWTEDIF